MAERTKSLVFPVGGLNRRFSIQRQPPFTTTKCVEMRPFDPLEERQRGGSRPGLASYPFDLGETEPVNLLSSVNVSSEANLIPNTAFDSFSGGARHPWEQHDLQGHPLGLIVAPVTGEGQARRFLPSNLHEPSGYTASLVLDTLRIDSPDRGIFDGWGTLDLGLPTVTAYPLDPPENWSRLQVAGFYDFYGPNTQFLVITILHMAGRDVVETVRTLHQTTAGDDEGSITRITLSATLAFGPPAQMRYTVVVEKPSGNLEVTDSTPFSSTSGSAIGCALQNGFGNRALHPRVRDFKIEYFVSSAPIFPVGANLLVGASGGRITLRTADGQLERPANDLEQKTKPLMAVDAIAPQYAGEPGDPGVPARTAGPRLFIADYTLLPTGGFDPDVQPKVYDPATNTLVDWVADRYEEGPNTGLLKGGVPFGNSMIARFLGRVFLAGNPPQSYAASRVFDPMDWDVGAVAVEDDAFAATGGILDQTADLNEPITALAPYLDDYMIFGTANRIYRLAGDPGQGHPILPISDQAGTAGPQAWCITPEGAMVFLDQERGLFVLAPGGQSYPQALSAEVLPRELKNINVQDTNVQLAYDHIQQGVHIILQSISGRENDHWWYDRRASGFWPLTLEAAHTPRVMLSFQGLAPSDSGVLLGGQDGVVRRFEESAGTDDGRVFTPSVLYGPFNLTSSDALEGVLRWIRATTVSSGSAGLQYEIVTGRTALDALDENSRHRRVLTGRVDEEFMKRHMVRLRGVVAFVRIFGTGTPWAIETLDVGVEPLAPPRP